MVRRARTTKGGSINSSIRFSATPCANEFYLLAIWQIPLRWKTFQQRMDGSLLVRQHVSVRYRTNTYEIP